MFDRNTEMDMTEGPLFKKLVAYAIPIMLTGILQLLFNAADLIVVGRFAGRTALAAVGSTTSLTNLLSASAELSAIMVTDARPFCTGQPVARSSI